VIITQPVAYGGGKPLFRDLEAVLKLKLLAATTYDTGTALRLFEPVTARAA
jgi:hypothetical protein